MPAITGAVEDAAGRPAVGTLKVRAPAVRQNATGDAVVDERTYEIPILGGTITSSPMIDPGPAKVSLSVGGGRYRTWDVVVPEGASVDLWDLIEQQIDYEPPVVSLVQQHRVAAETAAQTAEAAAASVEGVAADVAAVQEDRTAVEAARTEAVDAASTATAAKTEATTAAGQAATAVASIGTAVTDATTAASTAQDHASTAGTARTAAENARDAAAAAAAAAGTSETNAGTSAAAAAASAAEASDVIASGIPNASDTTKGGVLLTGDLGGTFDNPQVPALTGKLDAPTGGTVGQAIVKTEQGVGWGDVAADVPDASPTIKGTVALAGDLGGTAAAPTVPALAGKVGKGELMFNVKDYGAKGNGTTDDGPAIEAALAALVAVTGAYNAAGTLFFPTGRYIDSMAHELPATRRIHIRGASPYTTIIQRAANATGDWWTLNANSNSMSDLTLEGGRYQGATGDAVVLNATYPRLSNMQINKVGGTGITVGKAGPAIAPRVLDLSIDECSGYGVHVIHDSGSTDGMWVNLIVSKTGLSGFKLSDSAHNLLNLHVWGCGTESSTDYHGVWVTSTGSLFSNWQSEKNLGAGLYIQGNNNQFTGGRAWGNGLAGIRMLAATRNTFSGNALYWNGVKNTTGVASVSFAAIHVDGASTENVFTGNSVWDSATEIPAGNYVTTPTYPYPGRLADMSQPYAIAEAGTADFNVYVGNSIRKERARAGSYLNVGNSNTWAGNDHGAITLPTRSVVSGVVRIPAESDTILVTASAEITSVMGGTPGRMARIIFKNASPMPVRDNGTTLNLNGDFTPTTNDVLTLVSDGTNWYEVSRSAN